MGKDFEKQLFDFGIKYIDRLKKASEEASIDKKRPLSFPPDFPTDLSKCVIKAPMGGAVTKLLIKTSKKVFPELTDICTKFTDHLEATEISVYLWKNPSNDNALRLAEHILPTIK